MSKRRRAHKKWLNHMLFKFRLGEAVQCRVWCRPIRPVCDRAARIYWNGKGNRYKYKMKWDHPRWGVGS